MGQIKNEYQLSLELLNRENLPILEVLRPVKKVRGQWVEVKGKNGIHWVEATKEKRVKNG